MNLPAEPPIETVPPDPQPLALASRKARGGNASEDMSGIDLKDQLGAILDMSEMGVLLTDASGAVLHLNLPLCQMLAIEDVKTLGRDVASLERHVSTLLDPQDKSPSLLISMAKTLGIDGAALSPRQVLHLVVPRRATVQLTGRKTPKGDLVFYFRDITIEADVDRMKSEFLSTAAHELRTPLASIFGFTELLIARVMAPERQRELLETIHRQSKLLINLINELLDLSRIEARRGKDFHRQAFTVQELVELTLKGFLVTNDSRQVHLDMPHGAWSIMVDREKTMHALINVLSNAFKYSPNGGDISLKTVQKDDKQQRFLGIQVRDHGIGMTVAELGRVFERFFRANPSGTIPGTGLGMSLVKEITEIQGGHVQIESIYHQGSTVTLWFPAVPEVAAP
jgi:signal transduction histidine kinase